MGIFGWSYPAGAENDPNAPWNQEDHSDRLVYIDYTDIDYDELIEFANEAVGYEEHNKVGKDDVEVEIVFLTDDDATAFQNAVDNDPRFQTPMGPGVTGGAIETCAVCHSVMDTTAGCVMCAGHRETF
jgi:hypothetical protein